MKQILTIMLCLLFYGTTQAQYSFATADTMSAGVTKSGTVSSTVGQHYYKTWLPTNQGVVRLITSTANTGGAFGIVQYRVYWKNQNTINYYNVNRNALSSGADTFIVGAIEADSLYILVDNVWAGQTQNYTVKYDILYGAPNTELSASNDTRQTAEVLALNTNRDGYIGFGTAAGADGNDWYKIIFPRDGTFKLYVSARCMLTTNNNVMPRMYFYDRNGYANLGIYHNNNPSGFTWLNLGAWGSQAAFSQVADTLNIYGRAADTMYVVFDGFGSSWPATYSMHWVVTDTAYNNEPGPNETRATANDLAAGQIIYGDISYVGNGPDVDDYYRVVLDKDATITLYTSAQNTWNQQTNPAPNIIVEDKNGSQILNQNNAGAQSGALRVGNVFSLPFMGTVMDTMHVFGRAKDTFYIHVQNYHFGQGWAFAGHYTLRYQLDDTSAYNEAGPNETMATAQPITPADTIHGHVTYIDGGGGTDVDDYYRIVKPAGGSIVLYVTGRNTWGYINGIAGAPTIRVTDKTNYPFYIKSATGAGGGPLRVRNNGSLAYGQSVTDTMRIDCVSSDTVYVDVYNYFNFQYGGTSSSYDLRYEYVPGPKADLTYSRMGNELGFVNLSRYSDTYLWLMGNGQQYSSRYPPMTTYVPGNYDVKLVASSSGCSTHDTAKVNFTIAGVEYYTPTKAGRGGDVMMQIYGGDLSAATQVKLVKGSTVLTPRDLYPNSRLNHLGADFDLHFADTGYYDVVIQVPNQAPITYTKGFYVEALKYPYAWSQVTGPGRMRTGVDNIYTLLVGNKGNVTANGVVVAMVWPKNVQVTWKANVYKPDYSKNDTLLANSKTYVYPNSIFKYIYDSLTTTTAIDSFEGQPFDGYIRFFQVQHVPPGSTVEIPFIARAALPVATRFYTYTHRPNMLGSCPTGNYEDYSDDISSELLDAADMIADKSKIPALTAFTKSAKIGQHHMQSAATYIGKEFWAWWDGYETDHNANVADWIAETDANNEYAIQVAAQEVGGLLLNSAVSRAASANEQIKFGNRLLANKANMSPATLEATQKIMANLGKSVTGINYDRLKLLTDILNDTKNLYDLNEKLKKLEQLAKDCPELQDQIDELKKLLNQELDHQDPSLSIIDTRNSFDPNGIYGPVGVDTPRYIANVKRQPFVIHFENADTASADAQDVVIRDTIDKSRFDISSVTLGDIVIANQIYRVPKGRSEFTLQKSLANRPGMFVRITGKTDTASGVITWMLSSIDSASGNRPAFDGFLKPNVNMPEGEASVSYEVEPLSSLVDGTVLNSTASIVFDQNAAIATDVWSNKMDLAPPTSQISSATLIYDSTFVLRFSGSDASSGIAKYYVYCSTNGGPWILAAASVEDSLILQGRPDSSYRFYSLAIDKVENSEQKAAIAEASVTIPPTGVSITQSLGSAFKVYPNPADNKAYLQLSLTKEEHADIYLQSLTGSVIAKLWSGKAGAGDVIPVSIKDIPAGVYLVVMNTDTGLQDKAKIVVVH
ncbi:MAG: T9SS type A sorting domain-containing protein [Bacteroidetes bacterium]|nr:T9SS type A sorting domain-containing protein [Bacteroidota bacterium]